MILISDASQDYVLTNRGSRAMPIDRATHRESSTELAQADERVEDTLDGDAMVVDELIVDGLTGPAATGTKSSSAAWG